jgi:hypothetical protein
VLLTVLRDVRECSMLLSGACVSAAHCAQGCAKSAQCYCEERV